MDVRVAVTYRAGAPPSIGTVHLLKLHTSVGRRRHDHQSQYQSSPQSFDRKNGHDPLRQSEGSSGRHRALSDQPDQMRADFSFKCIGNVQLTRQALKCCHKDWGVSVIIGVTSAGQDMSTHRLSWSRARVLKRTALGGARGRTNVPKIVDGTWRAR